MEFAVASRSTDPVVDARLAWWCRAINAQLVQDFIPAHRDFFRRMGRSAELWPCVGYSTLDGLDPGAITPCWILDQVPAGELGSHENNFGIATARALAQGEATSVTLSHENGENYGDISCAIWIRQPDGGAYAYENFDGPERASYAKTIEFLGEKFTCQVSDFVLPSWYVPGSPGPWDFMGLLKGPGDVLPGSHVVHMDRDGTISTRYGNGSQSAAHAAAYAESCAHPLARTRRRLAGGPRIMVSPEFLAG